MWFDFFTMQRSRAVLASLFACATVASPVNATSSMVPGNASVASVAFPKPMDEAVVDVSFFDRARTTWGQLTASATTATAPRSMKLSLPSCVIDNVVTKDAYDTVCLGVTVREAIASQHAQAFRPGPTSRPVRLAAKRAAAPSLQEMRESVDLPRLEDPLVRSYAAEIVPTLQSALAKATLPDNVGQQVIHILKGKIDMRTRGQRGDYIRVTYEYVEGRPRVTAIRVQLRGMEYVSVWYQASGRSRGDYYAPDGRPFAGTHFALPVAAARVSSPFGPRVHPLSGEKHLHSGVDFAARTGTPVRASEEGIVATIGNDPYGYGRYVVVRHQGGYTSWYAHLSEVASGLRQGERVERGQRLGAVGSTGRATGPHLHFEVRREKRPLDPVELIQTANGSALQGQQLAAFKRVVQDANTRFAAAGLPGDRTRKASVG